MSKRSVVQGAAYVMSEGEAALVQRFDPSAPLDTIGFFIAKFVKLAAGQAPQAAAEAPQAAAPAAQAADAQ